MLLGLLHGYGYLTSQVFVLDICVDSADQLYRYMLALPHNVNGGVFVDVGSDCSIN